MRAGTTWRVNAIKERRRAACGQAEAERAHFKAILGILRARARAKPN